MELDYNQKKRRAQHDKEGKGCTLRLSVSWSEFHWSPNRRGRWCGPDWNGRIKSLNSRKNNASPQRRPISAQHTENLASPSSNRNVIIIRLHHFHCTTLFIDTTEATYDTTNQLTLHWASKFIGKTPNFAEILPIFTFFPNFQNRALLGDQEWTKSNVGKRILFRSLFRNWYFSILKLFDFCVTFVSVDTVILLKLMFYQRWLISNESLLMSHLRWLICQ